MNTQLTLNLKYSSPFVSLSFVTSVTFVKHSTV